MRDYKAEFENRVEFIKSVLADSGAKGIVYGNSGGKDSALVGILCKAACENTVGIIMPCSTKRNYDEDAVDAKEVAPVSIPNTVVKLFSADDTWWAFFSSVEILTNFFLFTNCFCIL